VKLLVENGAEVNTRDKDGKTAFIEAASYGHIEIVKYLLSKKANKADKDEVCSTLLYYSAVGHSYCEHSCLQNGWNALMVAANFGNNEVVEYLLARNLPIDETSKVNSPLYSSFIVSYHLPC
jgi:ankyrin repeat protein